MLADLDNFEDCGRQKVSSTSVINPLLLACAQICQLPQLGSMSKRKPLLQAQLNCASPGFYQQHVIEQLGTQALVCIFLPGFTNALLEALKTFEAYAYLLSSRSYRNYLPIWTDSWACLEDQLDITCHDRSTKAKHFAHHICPLK